MASSGYLVFQVIFSVRLEDQSAINATFLRSSDSLKVNDLRTPVRPKCEIDL